MGEVFTMSAALAPMHEPFHYAGWRETASTGDPRPRNCLNAVQPGAQVHRR